MKDALTIIKEIIILVILITMAVFIFFDEKKIEDLVNDQVKLEKRLDDLENNKKDENKNETSENEETSDPDEYVKGFKEISAKDITKDKKMQIIMIGRNNCGYCLKYGPILAAVSKEYGITPRYIDQNKLFNSEGEILDAEGIEAIRGLEETDETKGAIDANFGATPLTLVVENNQLIHIQIGYLPEDELKTQFENWGISK